ncbi:hypothetical protein [Bradyrhizobium elkanii]|uniref:hypothetical protein n=1 Tax=Bradyrhizobium elkanii TaxID=29448 RepID=UPI003D241E04
MPIGMVTAVFGESTLAGDTTGLCTSALGTFTTALGTFTFGRFTTALCTSTFGTDTLGTFTTGFGTFTVTFGRGTFIVGLGILGLGMLMTGFGISTALQALVQNITSATEIAEMAERDDMPMATSPTMHVGPSVRPTLKA